MAAGVGRHTRRRIYPTTQELSLEEAMFMPMQRKAERDKYYALLAELDPSVNYLQGDEGLVAEKNQYYQQKISDIRDKVFQSPLDPTTARDFYSVSAELRDDLKSGQLYNVQKAYNDVEEYKKLYIERGLEAGQSPDILQSKLDETLSTAHQEGALRAYDEDGSMVNYMSRLKYAPVYIDSAAKVRDETAKVKGKLTINNPSAYLTTETRVINGVEVPFYKTTNTDHLEEDNIQALQAIADSLNREANTPGTQWYNNRQFLGESPEYIAGLIDDALGANRIRKDVKEYKASWGHINPSALKAETKASPYVLSNFGPGDFSSLLGVNDITDLSPDELTEKGLAAVSPTFRDKVLNSKGFGGWWRRMKAKSTLMSAYGGNLTDDMLPEGQTVDQVVAEAERIVNDEQVKPEDFSQEDIKDLVSIYKYQLGLPADDQTADQFATKLINDDFEGFSDKYLTPYFQEYYGTHGVVRGIGFAPTENGNKVANGYNDAYFGDNSRMRVGTMLIREDDPNTMVTYQQALDEAGEDAPQAVLGYMTDSRYAPKGVESAQLVVKIGDTQYVVQDPAILPEKQAELKTLWDVSQLQFTAVPSGEHTINYLGVPMVAQYERVKTADGPFRYQFKLYNPKKPTGVKGSKDDPYEIGSREAPVTITALTPENMVPLLRNQGIIN